jgi:hypothetical protein
MLLVVDYDDNDYYVNCEVMVWVMVDEKEQQ